MILASKSPRRKEILEGFGLSIIIESLDIEEVSDKVGIEEQLMDIALKKALEVASKNPMEYIVAADTCVILGDKVLGKPVDKEDAKATLRELSGKKHRVVTAYVILNESKKVRHISFDETLVYFKQLEESEIEWYVDTLEPMDKAGSYGIQGKGSVLVEKIEGSYHNVMGFPISKFYDDLKGLGIDISKL